MSYYIINNILHDAECKKCKNALNTGLSNEYIANLDIVLGRDLRLCKCCKTKYQNYLEYKNIQLLQTSFLKFVELYAKKYNYSTRVLDNEDIEVQSSIERWIIHITSFEDMNLAKVVLYHRNNLKVCNNNKCGSSIYPEYHVQFKKVATPSELITYMVNHETHKWGVKVVAVSESTLSNKL